MATNTHPLGWWSPLFPSPPSNTAGWHPPLNPPSAAGQGSTSQVSPTTSQSTAGLGSSWGAPGTTSQSAVTGSRGRSLSQDDLMAIGARATPRNEAGGIDRVGGYGGVTTSLLAGAAGLGGNLMQMGLMKLFQPQYKEFQTQQAQLQQQLMDKYLPYMTTNRLGQFGTQAAIEAQRRSAEGSYSVPALANLGQAQRSASALENMASLLGSQAIQAAARQTQNIGRQLMNAGVPLTPAALGAIARNTAAGSAGAYEQALNQALSQASQNLAQAAQTRTGAMQGAEQSAERVYQTYKRPAETETDLKTLSQMTAAPMTTGMQIGEQLAVLPANPLQPVGEYIMKRQGELQNLQDLQDLKTIGVKNQVENPGEPSQYQDLVALMQDPRMAQIINMYSNQARRTVGGQYNPNLKDIKEQRVWEQDPNKNWISYWNYLSQFY